MSSLSINGVVRLGGRRMQIVLSGYGGSGERFVERVAIEVLESDTQYEQLFDALGELAKNAPGGDYRHDV